MLGLEKGNSLSNIIKMQIKYTHLCEEFLSVAQSHINENTLQVIKEHYSQHIDSNRKLGQIKSLRTLLKVLEKRDCLSYSNIEPFFYISNNFLNDVYIESKIKDYNFRLKNIQSFPLVNMYKNTDVSKDKKVELSSVTKSNILQSEVPVNDYKCQTSQSYIENHTTFLEQKAALQQKLLSQISEKIGRSWRDTARYLGVLEYQIDAIQSKFPFDLREQSYRALTLYISQYDNAGWELNLMHALEKARRRDLKELVEKFIINKYK